MRNHFCPRMWHGYILSPWHVPMERKIVCPVQKGAAMSFSHFLSLWRSCPHIWIIPELLLSASEWLSHFTEFQLFKRWPRFNFSSVRIVAQKRRITGTCLQHRASEWPVTSFFGVLFHSHSQWFQLRIHSAVHLKQEFSSSQIMIFTHENKMDFLNICEQVGYLQSKHTLGKAL